jgi:hypothetical protein
LVLPISFNDCSLCVVSNFLGRICRQGQKNRAHAYIIGDEGFFGDEMAFSLKRRRGEEDAIMKRPFGNLEDPGCRRVREAVTALRNSSEAEYVAWLKEENKRGSEEDKKTKATQRMARDAAQAAQQAAKVAAQRV